MKEKRGETLSMLGQSRGQITIFIIIAIVIIAVVVLLLFLRPGIISTTEFDERNPQAFMQTCLEPDITSAVDLVALQGGSINPEHFILYQDDRIEYLCYTDEYYITCAVQQPLLKQHIESEIRDEIIDEVNTCFNSLVENYESRGYNANLQTGITRVELLPKRVITSMDYILTVTRAETERHETFNVILNNNLYELISISNSIVEWEATFGDAETTLYMTYYKDLKVEKKKQQDGSTIYILTDRGSEDKFQFASRSVAWPPGYGEGGIASG